MSRLTANLLLTLTAVIWGSTFVVQKIGADFVSPAAFTAARLLLGALVVLPFALSHWRASPRALDRRDWGLMVLTGLVMWGASLAQQIGVGQTTVGNAGFLTGLNAPMVPIFELFLFARAPHPVVIPAAFLSLLGTYLMSGGSLDLTIGDSWIVLSSVFWAMHIILVGHAAKRSGLPTVLAVVQYLISATLCIAWAAAFEPPAWDGLRQAWAEVLYIGVMEVGLAYTLQTITQRHTNAADAAVIFSGEMLFAAIGGILVLGEHMTLVQALGGAAILAAMLAVQLGPIVWPGKAAKKSRL